MRYETGHLNWISRRSRAIHARWPNASTTLCEKPIKQWVPAEDGQFTCSKCRAFAFPMDHITPRPDYLAYSPAEGRYCLCVVWGYSFGTKTQVRFYISDETTGEEMQIFSLKFMDEAIAMRPKLVKQVWRMNKKDKIAA